MNYKNSNNKIEGMDVENAQADRTSVDSKEQRISWFTASELSGCGSFPTSARWTRDHLKELAEGKTHLARKRRGTKATEYHISLFPADVQRILLNNEFEGVEDEIGGYSIQYVEPDFLNDFKLIPLYMMQIENGSFIYPNLERKNAAKFKPVSINWLKEREFNHNDLVLIFASGDSMKPTINNNDTLIIHVGRNKPMDGHIYAFRQGDELLVKRFQSTLSTWRLISDNQIYDKIDIDKEKQDQIKVIGQVVSIGKDIGD
ncbi:S24 family peptidase [Shewanella oncorhynchi]|uniref:S24 family peptidase n=1 Tax=Shewanella TaxID=22 RepID=UPI0021DB7DF9|nr:MULTISPECIES: S24 family peptidase [unclassified Shewanella]MCU7999802.1 S24 family peptidase [Shewanella sp. SM95]MCU8004397.1 S24 family peptidase [Shewanella sp. SM96]MCU8018650.1 S24 family peptidase [Shewanella sp. SM72]MCU8020946.1 S24 family peptidase [Shewanella sp. SM78]MCU8040435.1 S24 family peptidase [Shewanella sp. SM69]